MNHKAMLELADRLEREMPRVNMKLVIHHSGCETVCCIAGWFCLWNMKNEDFKGYWSGPILAARRGLQLGETEANQLFFLGNWPIELKEQYDYNDDSTSELRNEKQVRLLSERIRRMVRDDITKVGV